MPSGVNFTSGGVPVAAGNETAAIEPLQKPSGVSGRLATVRNVRPPSIRTDVGAVGTSPGDVLANRLHQVAGREGHADVAPLRDGQLARRVHLASTTRIAPSPFNPGRDALIWRTAMPDRTPMSPTTKISSSQAETRLSWPTNGILRCGHDSAVGKGCSRLKTTPKPLTSVGPYGEVGQDSEVRPTYRIVRTTTNVCVGRRAASCVLAAPSALQ